MPPDSPHARKLIGETLDFLRHALNVQGAMFYWIAPELETENDMLVGLPAGLTERYRHDMWSLDPLLASRLARARKSIAELEREAAAVPAEAWSRYRSFLEGFGVAGNLDFLFWTNGAAQRAYAGISLVSMAGDPPLADTMPLWNGLHRYVAFNLQSHDRVRRERLEGLLRHTIGLTVREHQVCELVALGATNRDIAECLGLTLTTVKFYVAQIFDKMGAGNRTGLIARLDDLQRR